MLILLFYLYIVYNNEMSQSICRGSLWMDKNMDQNPLINGFYKTDQFSWIICNV